MSFNGFAYLLTSFVVLLLYSCSAPVSLYPTVEESSKVPNGTVSIITNEDIFSLLTILQEHNISYKEDHLFYKTASIKLEDQLMARYNIHHLDKHYKISAFYGLVNIESGDVHEWNLIKYNNKIRRPKKAFDFLVQLIDESGIEYKFSQY